MKIFIAILVAVTITQAGILETKSRNQKARPRGSDAPMDVKVEAVEPEIEPEDEPEDEQEDEPEDEPEPESFGGPLNCFPFCGGFPFPQPEPEWG